MEEVAEGVYMLRGFPRYAINAYLMGNVLVDAGIRWTQGMLMWQLRGRRLAAHCLTHAHPDHQGGSHGVCAALGLPLWCGQSDAAAMERGDLTALLPPGAANWLMATCFGGPGHRVSRQLGEGDRVGDFTVLETPGHTPGHVSFWRESDRVLILGDVLTNEHPLTQQVGLREPFARFTLDPKRNRCSARRVAELRPRVVCFGHGPPLRDPDRLARFCAGLPE